MADLEFVVSENIAVLTLNRPERKNAFTTSMLEAWSSCLVQAQEDNEVRSILVTGAGGAFCSGADIDSLTGPPRTPLQQKLYLHEKVHSVARALEYVDKPVVAAIDGAAVGAGMDMALMCDYRIASQGARFSEGYVRLGLVPGDGGCWLLPRLVGQSRALRLLWTGEFIDADQALHLGVVDEVVDDSQLRAREFCGTLAEQPPRVLQLIKRAVRQGSRHDFPTALDLISSHFAAIASSEDSIEARLAFQQKREATFYGR